jgi:THO complex subunit 3
MADSTEVDTGKIVYEWNPPTGIIDRYYYHDSTISQEDVSTTRKEKK